jgi:hypothetical protein
MPVPTCPPDGTTDCGICKANGGGKGCPSTNLR